MKVIDLLNKVANREEVPKKIKYDTKNYYFRNYDYKEYYIDEDYIDEQTSFIDCIDFYKLNDEIEIIEEDKPIEELLIEQDCPSSNYYIRNEFGTKCGLTKHSKMIAEKVNEIAREVNKLKKKENE